jgi:hypothetical protein
MAPPDWRYHQAGPASVAAGKLAAAAALLLPPLSGERAERRLGRFFWGVGARRLRLVEGSTLRVVAPLPHPSESAVCSLH